MVPRTVLGSHELGNLIRARRAELGLTIEQASAAGGLGSETWRRYEAGGSIRVDKARSVCKALRWRAIPSGAGEDAAPTEQSVWDLAATSEAYSPALVAGLGEDCARVFAAGCDYLLDQIDQDLEAMSKMPRGAHLGQLDISWLEDELPQRWLMHYDYEFLFRLRLTVERLIRKAQEPSRVAVPALTNSVGEALALHLIFQIGLGFVNDDEAQMVPVEQDDVDDWEYQLNNEDVIVTFALFPVEAFVAKNVHWHPDNWFIPYD